MNTTKDQLIDFPFPCSEMAFFESFSQKESENYYHFALQELCYIKWGKWSCWVGVKKKSRAGGCEALRHLDSKGIEFGRRLKFFARNKQKKGGSCI